MGQGQRRPEATLDIRRGQAAILVGVESIEHGIAAQPLLAGDAAIAVEVVEQKDLMNGMGEGRTSLQFNEAVGQLSLQGLDGLAEPEDTLI